MEARMKNPALVLRETLPAIQQMNAAIKVDSLPEEIFELAHLRASQINGCSVCIELDSSKVEMSREAIKRTMAVAGWRDSPHFTDAERAALALTEAMTRLSDREDPVPDEIWDNAARHFDEEALAALIMSVAMTNFYNRLNVTTRQVAGSWG